VNDLIEFLRARLDEDERKARARKTSLVEGKSSPIADKDVDYWADYAESTGLGETEADHIRNWLPSRALAEVDAKRRILGDYARAMERRKQHPDDMASAGALLALHGVVKRVASIYSDRDGYREEWRQ
jgi:hypothetical protein